MDRDNLGRELESRTGTEGSSPVSGEPDSTRELPESGWVEIGKTDAQFFGDDPADQPREDDKRWVTLEEFLKRFKPRPVEEVRGELFDSLFRDTDSELFRNLDNPVPWDHFCPALKRDTTAVSDSCEYCGVERPQARTDPEH